MGEHTYLWRLVIVGKGVVYAKGTCAADAARRLGYSVAAIESHEQCD